MSSIAEPSPFPRGLGRGEGMDPRKPSPKGHDMSNEQALREALEAQVRLWRHESAHDADDDAGDRAGRDAIRVCANELSAILAAHPARPRAAVPPPDRMGVQIGDGGTQFNNFGTRW